MMLNRSILALIMLFTLPLNAMADALILVPGYLNGGYSWRTHGITQNLVTNGWSDGGNFVLGPNGVRVDLPPTSNSHRFYSVELPSEAPLPLQANYLNNYIDAVQIMHPNEGAHSSRALRRRRACPLYYGDTPKHINRHIDHHCKPSLR